MVVGPYVCAVVRIWRPIGCPKCWTWTSGKHRRHSGNRWLLRPRCWFFRKRDDSRSRIYQLIYNLDHGVEHQRPRGRPACQGTRSSDWRDFDRSSRGRAARTTRQGDRGHEGPSASRGAGRDPPPLRRLAGARHPNRAADSRLRRARVACLMVIDTTALVAMLSDEPEAQRFETAVEAAHVRLMSTASYLETAIVIETRFGEPGGRELDLWLHRAAVELVGVDSGQADAARVAYRIYGKGRHRAGLNYGDCFSYALAKVSGQPLLFKGDDFARTDIRGGLAS